MTRTQFKQFKIPIIVIVASFPSAAGRQNTFSAVLSEIENNGSACTFTWQNGRELASGTKGSTSFAYTYNADGLRTQKVVGNLVYTYYWQGSQLAAMTIGTSNSVGQILKFYYDSNGIPFALNYNGINYLYITNLQGDVIGIASNAGVEVTYTYDAWGKVVSTTTSGTPAAQNVFNANPLLYRGYIYDNETGFYYLQSRYYDPAVRRFISADSPEMAMEAGITDKNLFAYCDNNPIMRSDEDGEFWNVVSGAIIGGLISATTQVISNLICGEEWYSGVLISAASGAISGGLAATGLGKLGQGVANALINAGASALGDWASGNKGIGEIVSNAMISASLGFASGYFGGNGIRKSGDAYSKAKSGMETATELVKNAKNKVQKHMLKIAAKDATRNFNNVYLDASISVLNYTLLSSPIVSTISSISKWAMNKIF